MASIYKPKSYKGRRNKPWLISYTDENGIRKVITGSPDKSVSKELARAKEAEVLRRKHGLSTKAEDQLREYANEPILNHIRAYLDSCNHRGLGKGTIELKKSHLMKLIKYINANRLIDLEPLSIESYLSFLKETGKSARTINHYRQDLMAFVNWCVKIGRLKFNTLSVIPKLNERKDRRRVRRPLSNEELVYLFRIAKQQDKLNFKGFPRYPVYVTAVYTGLRRKELRNLHWGDVDLENKTINVRIEIAKASREDIIPLHIEVINALKTIKPKHPMPTDNVFITMPSIETFHKDIERGRRLWIDESKNLQERENRENSDFLKAVDSSDRHIDLHAMRTTLGTRLALNGVVPQVAQKIMRHSDYRTTLKHYTVLGIEATSNAIAMIPGIEDNRKSTKNTKTG